MSARFRCECTWSTCCRRPRGSCITLFTFLQKHTIFNFQNYFSSCFVCQACTVGFSVVYSSDMALQTNAGARWCHAFVPLQFLNISLRCDSQLTVEWIIEFRSCTPSFFFFFLLYFFCSQWWWWWWWWILCFCIKSKYRCQLYWSCNTSQAWEHPQCNAVLIILLAADKSPAFCSVRQSAGTRRL